jgi:hypothetical protein
MKSFSKKIFGKSLIAILPPPTAVPCRSDDKNNLNYESKYREGILDDTNSGRKIRKLVEKHFPQNNQIKTDRLVLVLLTFLSTLVAFFG